MHMQFLKKEYHMTVRFHWLLQGISLSFFCQIWVMALPSGSNDVSPTSGNQGASPWSTFGIFLPFLKGMHVFTTPQTHFMPLESKLSFVSSFNCPVQSQLFVWDGWLNPHVKCLIALANSSYPAALLAFSCFAI